MELTTYESTPLPGRTSHEAAHQLFDDWSNLTVEQKTDKYFLATVHHRIVDELRRQDRYVELTEDLEESTDFPRVEPSETLGFDVDRSSGEVDTGRLIDRLVEAMPVQRKAVWLLVTQQGFTYQDVAEQLALKYPTVGRHMALARETLRKGLTRAGLRIASDTITALIPRTTGEASDE